MSIPEAFKGAALEISRIQPIAQRVKYVARTSGLLVNVRNHPLKEWRASLDRFKPLIRPKHPSLHKLLHLQELLGTLSSVPFAVHSLRAYNGLKRQKVSGPGRCLLLQSCLVTKTLVQQHLDMLTAHR